VGNYRNVANTVGGANLAFNRTVYSWKFYR